jgi:hypothetical protein
MATLMSLGNCRAAAKIMGAKSKMEVPMRRWVTVTLAGVAAAATFTLGIAPASAATRFTCTRTVHHHIVKVTVRRDRAEDALEAHGFRCTRG